MGAQRLKLTSEMQFVQEALRSNRATLQKFSMKQLRKPDPTFQPRAIHLNMDHVKNLGDILVNLRKVDRDLEPGVIFRDAKQKWLALVDGFHRHEAYRLAKSDYFPAYVIEGTKDEAIEYAAMSNQHAMLRRTPEDIKKQIYMLMGLSRWFGANDAEIANHVGCSQATASKYRSKFCEDRDIPLPKVTYYREGTLVSKRRCPKGYPDILEKKSKNGSGKDKIRFIAFVGGKKRYLAMSSLDGPDRSQKREEAAKKLAEIVGEGREKTRENQVSLNHSALIRWFHRRGVDIRVERFDGNKYPGVSCFRFPGFLVGTCESFSRGIFGSVGSLMFAREILGDVEPGSRAVVLCYPDDVSLGLIEIANRLGFEFLTPEQLVASIKGDAK